LAPVIGTVYGAQLGAAGNSVTVLAHGHRTDAITTAGLLARDMRDGRETRSPANVIAAANEGTFDLVVVALRRDHLHSAAIPLASIHGRPLVLFLGNNPAGRSALPVGPEVTVSLGFPGVGGTMTGAAARYVKIRQQPTTIEASADPRLAEVAAALKRRGFAIRRVSEIEGWLAFHAVFVACVCAALYHCESNPAQLAGDRSELRLMCHAITEGFRALRADHVGGLSKNLAILHNRFLTRIAILYWARAMRTPLGELAFAAHARHAESEMRALAHDVLLRLASGERTKDLQRLLSATGS
jgi:ketopantoate reductase